ncbi:MAG: site-specific integrase, partial [Spirochaetales bacterium]|nr:site-specific integrase [Spirochaetales bacterium]
MLPPIVEEYEQYLRLERRLSRSTITIYSGEVTLFIDSGLDADTIDSDGVQRYIVEQTTGRDLSGRSVAKVLSALRSFFTYLQQSGFRDD